MSVQNRRKYDSEFKRTAVLLSEEPGRTVPEVAANLGISSNLIYRWRRQMGSTSGIDTVSDNKFLGLDRLTLPFERIG